MTAFAGPLPGPLARLRALRIQRAGRAGRARAGKTATVDGFELLLPEGVPAPLLVGGLHPDSFLGRNLDVRPGESVLVLPAGSGLLALHAARAGCEVTAVADRATAKGLERSFRLAGFGAPGRLDGVGPTGAGGGDRIDGPRFGAVLLGQGRGPVDLAALAGLLGRGGRLLMAAADRDSAGLRTDLSDAGLRWTTLVLRRDPILGPIRVLRAWPPRAGEPAGYVAAGEALHGAGWVLRDR